MATKVTDKGQVTLPKHVREAADIRPGDTVEVRATASGAVVIEKPGLQGEAPCLGAAPADSRHQHGRTADDDPWRSRTRPSLA